MKSQSTARLALLILLTCSGAASATCLSLNQGYSTGAISTESASVRNSCNTRVGYVYCVDSSNGGGAFSCRDHKFGTDFVGPGSSKGISIMGANTPFRVYWYDCQAERGSNLIPTPQNARFAGGRITASGCR
jgi:uncharacterized protein YcfL